MECQIRNEDKNTGCRFDLRYLGRCIRAALFGLLISSGLWTVGGCTSVGPAMLKGERINYNVALQNTNDEQMLLNLVRLRYRDTPIFLDVNSIATQFTIEAGLEAGAELPESTANIFNLGGRAAYSIQPTVTYSPLEGEKFIQRLLSPISLDTIMLLYQSGWSLKRVFRLCVQRLNDVENAVRASGPTPEKAPEYRDFARAIDLMRGRQRLKLLDFTYETFPSEGREPRIVLLISEKAWAFPETHELAEILGLIKKKRHYPLTYPMVTHKGVRNLNRLMVEPRSLLGILFFLCQAVEVSREDVERGKVTVTRHETGEPFDWKEVTGELIRISSQSSQPFQAAVVVSYRGSWFYIDDSDLESKSTFPLLVQLFALQAGEKERIMPILTLPVGR